MTDATIYFENEHKYVTTINSSQITRNIDSILLNKIREDIEGKCMNEGFVMKDSIVITGRSLGRVMASHFNGDIIYNVTYRAKLCNPHEGQIIKSVVTNINKMGVLADVYNDDNYPLNILLAKQHHINNDYFSKLVEGDIIYIEILGKRFEFGDTKIAVIGKLAEKQTKKPESKLQTIIFSNKTKTYRWLSMYDVEFPFQYNSRKFISVEHAFNASKNSDKDFKDLFTSGTDTYIGDLPNLARKTANKTNMKKMKKVLVEGWESKKTEIMEEILREKFRQNPDIKIKLKNTGSNIIVFKGMGADTFWGVDKDDKGENTQGVLLMKIRDSI